MIQNQRSVRIVKKSTWDKVEILFPDAICHSLNTRIIERGCDLCSNEKKLKLELPSLLLAWANNSLIVVERLERKASHDDATIENSESVYLVHSSDVHNWKRFIGFVRKTCPPKKGKEENVANQLISKISNTFFLQVDDSNMDETPPFDIRWRMHKLTCIEHNRTSASMEIIHQALSSKLPATTHLEDGIVAVSEKEYFDFISSMVELQSLVCQCVRDVPFSVQNFHPRVKLNQNNFSRTGYNRILQENATAPTTTLHESKYMGIVLSPPICTDVTCLNKFSSYLNTNYNDNEKSIEAKPENKNKAPIQLDVLECETSGLQLSDEELIQVNVHEFDTACDITKSINTVEKEFNGKLTVSGGDDRTIRRSTRKRNGYQSGKNTFSLNVSKEANLATFRLQIYEQCINKDIEDHTLFVFAFDSTKGEGLHFELRGEWNERLFCEIVQDCPFEIDPKDTVQVILNTKTNIGSKRRRRTSKNTRTQEETALFDVLLQMSNLAHTSVDTLRPGKRRREERGFAGTFLQSTAEKMQPNTISMDNTDTEGGSDMDAHPKTQTPESFESKDEQKDENGIINVREVILIDD